MRLDLLLEQSARRYPSLTAVVEPNSRTVSYGVLNELSNQIGERLVEGGVAPGDRVGIYAPKTAATLASIFGVLKAGAAYVPVDPNAPPSRNAYIFEDCGVKAVIVERNLTEGLRRELTGKCLFQCEELPASELLGADFVLLAAGHQTARAFSPLPDGQNLAYILYTSGSTGKPKGVMHTHASALSFVDWCSEEFKPRKEDRFSSHAPFHFDLSIQDIYVPIKHGAAIVLFGEELGKQPLPLASTIAKEKVSVWYSTPSILRLLVEYGKLESFNFSALRIVLFAGEVFPIKHLRALQHFWSWPVYYNLYGPTETNVCTYYKVPGLIPDDRTEPLPIGRDCSGDRSRVVGQDGQEVPPDTEGELHVSGGSVMLGYWNRPDRNCAAFNLDPSGIAWYKTGDIVKQNPDGEYIFVGRRDRMIKRRGFRVELGEIESALYQHPEITEAAVIASQSEDAELEVKAFFTWIGEKPPSTIALKRFCAERLPLYMIPDRFLAQPQLPKTSTDKIDYQSLKEFN